MSAAHILFEKLGMDLAKGATTAYPATTEGPSDGYRFWAAEVGSNVQFGIQRRSASEGFDANLKATLGIFGFRSRPNKREMYVSLSNDVDLAQPMALLAIGLLRDACALGGR
jgi:hypothetical protein